MQAQSGSGGMTSELNVTPLIDVVLVLLIIFMVVTPKTDQQVSVAIPQDAPAPSAPSAEKPPPLLVVGLSAEGKYTFSGKPVEDVAELRAAIQTALQSRTEKVVFLEASPEAPYEAAMVAMDVARLAGAAHLGWVDPPQ